MRPPQILDRHYKIRPITDHRAKFHAGRPTHLGDFAGRVGQHERLYLCSQWTEFHKFFLFNTEKIVLVNAV